MKVIALMLMVKIGLLVWSGLASADNSMELSAEANLDSSNSSTTLENQVFCVSSFNMNFSLITPNKYFVVSNSINCVSTNSTVLQARKIEVETRAHESRAKRYCLKKANHLACRSLGSIPT